MATSMMDAILELSMAEILNKVPLDADIKTGIKNDRHRQRMPAPRGFDPASPVRRAHIGRIDHC